MRRDKVALRLWFKAADSVAKKLMDDIMELGGDIVRSQRFEKAWNVPHHYEGRSIADHSLETAEYALRIARLLNEHGTPVNVEDAVRASLMHDIGMTVDEVFLSPSYRKAYSHPREGARIAWEEFGANSVQVDAILHHMWPIGFIPPHSLEGWVVVAADKCCSMHESKDAVGVMACRIARIASGKSKHL